MKSTKILFLFFFALLFCFKQKCEAQNDTDSLSYYVKFIKDSKENKNLVDAILYLQKANIKNHNRDSTLGIIYNLTYIARAQRKIGLLHEGEKSAIEAIKLLDELDDSNTAYRISLYNFLGILYLEYKDYKTSLKYYKLVLKINNDPESRVTIINNIGNVYKGLNDYKSAINFYKVSYDSSLNYSDKKKTARALDNLGLAQSKIFNSDALENLTKALEIRSQLNFQQGVITSYLHLGEYYKDRNNRKMSLSFANKAIKIAELNKNIDFKKSALSFYVGLSTDLRVLELRKLNDSISLSNQQVQNKYISKKYDYEKQERIAKENELKFKNSELKTEQQKNKKIIGFSIASIIALLSVFLYFILKSKHKKDKLQQVFNTESRISKKVHDEVANDVFQVMTKLQSETPNDELLDEIEEIYNKTRDISKEHSVIDLEGNFESILNDLILSYNNTNTNVIAKGISKVDWDAVSELKRVTIYKVLQELLINMKKHSKASVVVLTFDVNRKTIVIHYSDNGIGCDLKKGTGLQNVENRIVSINGTITFDSEIDKGFKVKLTV